MDSRPVVTIGNFDGVHLGHRALLAAARELAGSGSVTALTFAPSPRDVMQPGHGVPQIQTLDDRVRTLREAGADEVTLVPFTQELSTWSPERFARDILAGEHGAAGVVVGWDFRFGKGRSGTPDTLRTTLGVPVVEVQAVLLDGAPVSSTRTRQAVLDGDLGLAARLLTRPHEVVGRVVRGDQRGRTLGVPTANVRPDTELLPPPGVYAVRAWVDGVWVNGVANLGDRPTFGPGRGRLEVHLLDGSWELYDQVLRVALVARLRDEVKFDGVEALVAQIHSDIHHARDVLRKTP